MKRDDGINRSMPLSTHSFGRMNPLRFHIVRHSDGWRIYRGAVAVFPVQGSFSTAIQVAQRHARASAS